MAENDIYNNKAKYDAFVANLENYLQQPSPEERRRKYWIKNKSNINYFRTLFTKFAAKDLSFIRRLRLLRTLLMAAHVIDIDLADCTREDIDKIMAFAHSVNKSVKTKRDFAIDMKYIWKLLFPELDDKGRADETIFPYVVRHLSGKIDKSKEKLRGDKFSLDEFEKLVQSFSDDPRMQCLLTLSLESLGRPQELLYTRLKDVELFDGYAKVYISEHGKEGTGFLRCIDSYFYLSKWINAHPLKKDKSNFLFINLGRTNRYEQMKPSAANKLIRERCLILGIKKPITLYSLKRNGVTMLRLQGKSDLDIQHTARWTSSKQLKTYDMSNQEESFIVELVKRGKIKADNKFKEFEPTSKKCLFCGMDNGLAETSCANCKRPLDREIIEAEAKKTEEELATLKYQMSNVEKILLSMAKSDPRYKKAALLEQEENKKNKKQGSD